MSTAPRTETTPAIPVKLRAPGPWRIIPGVLLGLALLAGADRPPAPPAAPLDEPLRLIALARARYAQVRDYSCVLVKRERMNGQLGPDNVMLVKVRARPFGVYMQWKEPRSLAGQEVCYVAGRNNGQMRVRPTGLLGAVGFVSLDPNDPRARKTSRHAITEAGIGNLIERLAHGWEAERALGLTQVQLGRYEFSKRRCTRVETTHLSNPQGRFRYHRTIVYFDDEHHLPVRIECYGWPRTHGDPGALEEMASFVNLRLDVGLTDAVFDH